MPSVPFVVSCLGQGMPVSLGLQLPPPPRDGPKQSRPRHSAAVTVPTKQRSDLIWDLTKQLQRHTPPAPTHSHAGPALTCASSRILDEEGVSRCVRPSAPSCNVGWKTSGSGWSGDEKGVDRRRGPGVHWAGYRIMHLFQRGREAIWEHTAGNFCVAARRCQKDWSRTRLRSRGWATRSSGKTGVTRTAATIPG